MLIVCLLNTNEDGVYPTTSHEDVMCGCAVLCVIGLMYNQDKATLTLTFSTLGLKKKKHVHCFKMNSKILCTCNNDHQRKTHVPIK